jgi:predicted transcriptional regulator
LYPDASLAVTAMLLIFSIGVMLLYYRRIRAVHQEYGEAKTVVKDIVISFNNQLQRLEKRIEAVAHRIEFLSVKTHDVTGVTEKLKDHETQLSDITSKVQGTLTLKEQMLLQIKKLNERVNELAEAQKRITQQISRPQETKIEGVIPFRREKALAQLTPTELRVLEILTNEGQKTSPEIKNKIELTREHTARLMKKLYEKGYVERDETKTPYEYRIKEEMQKILKKTKPTS